MKMKLISLIVLLSACYLGNAQNKPIVTIKDKKTNSTIPFVTVKWQSVNTNYKGNCITDKNGNAEVPIDNGLIILNASCVGFKKYNDTIEIKGQTLVFLEEDVLSLEQFTITGTQTPRTVKEAPVLTQIITSKDIRKISIPRITEILETEMPGIEMTRHGYGNKISMQGMDSQYTLFLIDGERMAGETGGNIDYSRINTANIEQIEIIRGANSVLYGSNAMGGVVNIITKKPRKSFEFFFESKLAEKNQINNSKSFITNVDEAYLKDVYRNQDLPNLSSDLIIGFKNKCLYSSTYIGFKSLDAYQLYDTKELVKFYPSLDSTAKAPLNITNIDGFKDYTISNKTGFTFAQVWNVEVKGSYYNHENFDFDVRNNKHELYKDYNWGAFVERKFNNESNFKISHNTDNYMKYEVFEMIDENKLKYKNVLHHSKILFTSQMFEKHNYLIGLENTHDILEADKFEEDTMLVKSTNDIVIILQDEFNFNKSVNLTFGLRSGYHSAFEAYLTPSVSLKINKNFFNYRFSVARGFRSPSQKELYMNWSHQDFVMKGNANLKPETNNYYSFSVDYINPKSLLNATLITSYNHIYNKIDIIGTNDLKEYNYLNINVFKAFNAEVLLKWRIINNLQFKSGYVFTKVFEDDNTIKLSTVSPHACTAQLEYTFSKGFYEVTANISGKITGSKEYYEPENQNYYLVKLPTYSLWNFNIYQQFGKYVFVNTGVKNILDYKAPIVNFNTSTTVGRRVYVSLGIKI